MGFTSPSPAVVMDFAQGLAGQITDDFTQNAVGEMADALCLSEEDKAKAIENAARNPLIATPNSKAGIAGSVSAGPIGVLMGLRNPANVAKVVGNAAKTARVGELIPTHGKTMSNKQLDKLTKDIRAEGIKEPLTVTEHQNKLYILDGHHRALAAPRAGVLEVPINKVELPFGAYKTPNDLIFSPGGY